MVAITIERLNYLCVTIPKLLSDIEEDNFSLKISSAKWSKKEIIGHLIDSATNNHHRFVQMQFEDIIIKPYDQNKWNERNFYQDISGHQIIDFWAIYNQHLLEIIKRMTEEDLQKEFASIDNKKFSLAFLVKDYVEHLEHHLRQVVDY